MSRRVTTREDIAAVIALYKANHVPRQISARTGVGLRVVQNLVKRFRELGEDVLPSPLPKSGRPKLLSPRTLKVISRQVRSNPSLTARDVKERNPCLLSHISLRCVQQALHDDLEFKSFRACRKPLLTRRQKENRVKF
ncbi:putative winged helix-turn-helix domain containing protein 6 [Homarus americanus]|uniref:Putative winged helix-turn-helix domain containing protein 6 n=1 Tax=Homarus americanus TaxID=6706 RepID=A0A8J5N2N2_HOMAM|nr:putative winged helix-turn-helix domain containing protein 6 [Homarus americanus]